MNFDLNFLYGIVYTLFLVIAAVVVVAAMIWRKFRTFLIEELSAKLVSPLKQEVNSNEERLNKLERRVETIESRLLENQQSINQKFETIIRDVADLKGRLEGMLGKFDLYLKLGENKYGKEN